jgi:hypothetical protein
MAFTLVARLNLGGAPTVPIFPEPDVCVYRVNNTDCRIARIGPNTDALLSNALIATGTNINLRNGVFHAGYAVFANGSTSDAATVNFVNMSTGVVTTIQSPAGIGKINSGTVMLLQAGAGAYRIGMLNHDSGLNTGHQLRFTFPPGPVLTDDSMIDVNTNMYLRTEKPWGGGGGGIREGLASLGHNILNRMQFQASPNYIATLIDPPAGYIYGENSTTETRVPYYVQEDNLYLYHYGLTTPAFTPFLHRYNKTTGAVDTINLSAVGFTQLYNFINAARIVVNYRRLYHAFDENAFRIFGAFTDWPVAPNATFDADVNLGPGSITGIGIYPPFVYLAKTTGTNFGNQFIKLYDSDLDITRKRRHRGGELWSIIPEVSNYLSE